jgi:hypothetical protein
MKVTKLLHPAFLVLTFLLLAGAVGMRASLNALEYHLRKLPVYAPNNKQLRSLPTEVGDWVRRGNDQVLSPEVVEELGTSNYLDRVYVKLPDTEGRGKGETVAINLHLAYYTGMIDAVPHVPERCFVGGGLHVAGGPWWKELPLQPQRLRLLKNYYEDGYDVLRVPGEFEPQGRDTVRLPHLPEGEAGPVMRITEFENPRLPGRPMYAGYMFLANGRFVANAEEVRLAAFDLSDDYAYYMKIQFSSGLGDFESPDEFAEASAELFNELLPGILLCVPDWVEVQRGTYPPDNPRGANE